jgi:chromosome segregation ATPase
MARVTAEFRKQYAPYTRNGLLQIIAEMREKVEEAQDGRADAITEAEQAEQRAGDAEWERDKLQEGITRLEDEARYARGMKLPTAKTYADAVADYAGLSPHNIERLV